jgi:hypothetical protein
LGGGDLAVATGAATTGALAAVTGALGGGDLAVATGAATTGAAAVTGSLMAAAGEGEALTVAALALGALAAQVPTTVTLSFWPASQSLETAGRFGGRG